MCGIGNMDTNLAIADAKLETMEGRCGRNNCRGGLRAVRVVSARLSCLSQHQSD
uniref:Uncharacterized protein n=1 Tax=Arundo donax TaxID=35708 RepID=A0A0A9B7W8_ARUDO